MKIILVDRTPALPRAWQTHFVAVADLADDEIEVHCGDIFEHPAEAIVSPANSFGFMNGGIDLFYAKRFGPDLEPALREELAAHHNGELLVGEAVVINTMHQDFPHLISAPTMRMPSPLVGTANVYLAMRAAIREAIGRDFESVAIPGLGTGVGGLPPVTAATQMRMGYIHARNPPQYADITAAYKDHRKIMGVDD